jgi:SHS2 domain-containing protein
MPYKFLEHKADVKFLASGSTIERAFKASAMALQETMTKGAGVKSTQEREIDVQGDDFESLLYHFLEEFLFLLDAESFLFSEVKEIKINPVEFKLHAVVSGDDAVNYQISNDVKAITYNDMFVKHDKNGWQCLVVVDV